MFGKAEVQTHSLKERPPKGAPGFHSVSGRGQSSRNQERREPGKRGVFRLALKEAA